MKISDILTERIQTDWVRPWISSTVKSVGPFKNGIEWYSKLFKLLNSSKQLSEWKKLNISEPLVIKPVLVNNTETPHTVVGAEHYFNDKPFGHVVSVTVNTQYPPKNQKLINGLIDSLSSFLVHELNHASQHNKQQYAAIETDVWKIEPPTPKTKAEAHYLYMLNHMEQDAWISQIANDIHNAFGNESLKYLNEILKKSRKDDYFTANGKIIPIGHLNTLFAALNYYGKYLKNGPEQSWEKVKKELYGYLSRYDKEPT